MFDLALPVTACLRSGTRADVGWVISSEGVPVEDPNRAVAFTPGGGRLGGIDSSVIDGALSEHAGIGSVGRLVDIVVSEVDALISGLGGPGKVTAAIAPAESLPARLWDLASDRIAFCLVGRLAGGEISSFEVYAETDPGLPEDVVEAFASPAGSQLTKGQVISVFRAAPRLVVVGSSPIVDALVTLAEFLGWQAGRHTTASHAQGVIASLTEGDMVVVAAHDLELAGAALLASLDSRAGYIGSVGSRKMQENRADWLAYRGVTDLDRIHGPAGLDIGASSPAEIAVSIVAEAIATTRGRSRTTG
ncbi:MAG TPA: XdhC family protein [Acidimicrobiia bacterium]